MKRLAALCSFLVLSMGAFAQQESRPTIAVLDFETSGISQGEMRLLLDFISSKIIETGKYRVIDRAQRQTVLSEIEFSNSDCTDEECQLEIGQMLSADQIIVGSLGKFGERYLITIKMIEVRTAQSTSASSNIYASLNDLLEDSRNLVLQLVQTEAGKSLLSEATPPQSLDAPAASAEHSLQQVQSAKPEETVSSRRSLGFEIPEAAIRLDGKTQDWLNIPPLIGDRVGDDWKTDRLSGTDIAKVFLARDHQYLYVLFELADGRPNSNLSSARYVEYNLNLYKPSAYTYIRLQTRYTENRWKAELTKWDANTRKMTVLSSGRLRIRANFFEARYPLTKIFDNVDTSRPLSITANIGFLKNQTWVDTDSTATVAVCLTR
jgi:TolB-like protein